MDGKMDGSHAAEALVKECSRPLPELHGVLPTQLFSRNKEAKDVNSAQMAALPGRQVSQPYSARAWSNKLTKIAAYEASRLNTGMAQHLPQQ